MDCTVRSARRSEVKNLRPTPLSGSSVCSVKIDAGISTLVPVLGITNLCHSWQGAGEANVTMQTEKTADRNNRIEASSIRMSLMS